MIAQFKLSAVTEDQRYDNPWYGRFNTPDPSGSRAATPANPVSWNMNAYVGGDPINRTDHRGLVWDGGDSLEWADGGGGGGWGCFVNALDPVSSIGDPGECAPQLWQPPLDPGPPPPTCEDTETAYVQNYLSKRDSPLAAEADLIVTYSDLMGVDDRFIVALAGKNREKQKNRKTGEKQEKNRDGLICVHFQSLINQHYASIDGTVGVAFLISRPRRLSTNALQP